MGIVYRHQKNEPLTIEEMDGNFAYLDGRLKSLETKPTMAEGIARLIQEGDQVTVEGTFGSVLGKFTLPKVMPSFKGKWKSGESYRVLDWVQMERGLYSCTVAHTASDFLTEKEKWTVVMEG